ncbi:Respiratory burst oxidase-like protein E [Triticum urartu]|uniref:Respiratory burst oxidase-like protein E n=1 Tax=Triticum urartu TaxID=4572 RepID=M7ZU48_TRIUA|nr:Respiratory burst oxidase-like protein E [Triticum urartu]
MVDSKEFAVGIFDALARRRRQNLQRVTKEELRDFWLQISDQSFDARLQIFFDMVDTNVDGRITREEVQELIVLSASANKLSKLKEQAEEYALLIMEELDPEGLGYIEGAAETLKLNMALVLLPVCRITLTRLRSSWARFLVPLDDCIAFHKVIAMAIAAGICLHAGNHLACDFPRLIASSPGEYRPLAGFFGEERPTYRSLLSGVVGVTGVVMVVLMAVSFTLAARPLRRAPTRTRLPSPLGHLAGFNAFWYSHHLLVVVYLLLLVHGWFIFLVTKWYQRTTWMYIAVPFALHVGERTLRALRSKAYAAKILKVCLLPGNVLTITMSKPCGFRYRSGQYVFLQCPTISPFEWHPFSITSAPGDDYISVHIQTRGDWTQELKHIFVENYFSPCLPSRASFGELGMPEQKSPPRLLVDGPYGAPAQDFRNYDVLLLVGLGIGATPFISILRDLLNNIKLADELMDLSMETSRSEDSSNTFSVSTASSNKRRAYRTSRAHFYWVTREPGSFEWFKSVMDEVAEMDKKGVIELHNYLTSVYEERDARTTLLSMVQALNHAKNGIDIVSGTRVRTHFARPNWREEFTRISAKHPGVFYCGKPTLAKELKKLSLEMSRKTTTRFHFHKEYF